MKLPIPFISDKNDTSKYYLALLLTDEKASAVILEEITGKIKIIGQREEFFSDSIEVIPQEELIDIVDKTISRAEEILPPDIETHKTVFGVKESWVEPESKKIKKAYLDKLKKVCDSLDLSPIGFMVITEAIAHLMQEEEGAPLSAVLIEVGRKIVTLTLIRGGKIVETIQGPLKDDIPAAVDTLLKHFTIAVLPARVLLFHTESGEKLAQQFISHQWSKSLPFLHVPQITVLPSGFDAKAVTFGAASQMGFEVLNLPPVTPEEIKSTVKLHHKKDVKTEEKEPYQPEDEDENLHEKPDALETSQTEQDGENFGFVMNQDIATITPKAVPEDTRKSLPDEHHKHEEKLPQHSPKSSHHTVNLEEPDEEDFQEGFDGTNSPENSSRKLSVNPGKKLPAFPKISLPKLRLSFAGFGKNRIPVLALGIFVIIVLLGFGLFYLYLYKVKATVVLSVKPKMDTQSVNVVFSNTSPSDFSKNVIAAKDTSAAINGELSTDTTGKKEVGEKAKGSVTIYNNSDSPAELSNGTQIKSSNGLVFLTDKDVTIASASGDIFSGTKPGTSQASVTAKDIGTDYNLPSATKFSIGSNSTLAAKNDSAFSEGSKKTITVVSKDDIAKLNSDLPKSLEQKAKDAMSQKAATNETVLQVLISIKMEKPVFDKKVGDEAKKLKLKAKVVFGGMVYDNDELTSFAKSIIKSRNSQGISFADNSIKQLIKDAKEKSEKEIQATVSIQAGLLPNIEKDDVLKKIQGKSLKEAEETLSSLPQVTHSDIKFSPNIPLLPVVFQRLPNNITVESKPE